MGRYFFKDFRRKVQDFEWYCFRDVRHYLNYLREENSARSLQHPRKY
jgi:hypothetical protein